MMTHDVMNAGRIDWRATFAGRKPRYVDAPLIIDISDNQGIIDWGVPGWDEVEVVIIRASVGNRKDKYFPLNWAGARRRKKLRMAYHALYPALSIAAQVSLFHNQMGDDKGELPPCWDCERIDGCTQQQIMYAAQYGLDKTNIWYENIPVLYSSVYYLEKLFDKKPWWVNVYTLYLAHYLAANPISGYAEEHPGPLPLPEWIERKNVAIHQTAGKGIGKLRVPGLGVQSLNLDYDRYLHGKASLYAWAGVALPAPAPTTAEILADHERRILLLEAR